jgi:pimeloyl-ACP methyl ester carboxylesterase
VDLGNLCNVLHAYGEGNVFGQAYGDGPVQVVWLHGWAHTSADFTAAGELLAHEGISSVALDLPGFGASPLPATAGGAQLYADLLVPVLATVSSAPLVLVGHSFGGRVGTVLAAEHPELVAALVLTGVPLLRLTSTRRSPLAYRALRQLHRRGLLGDARMEAARRHFGSSDYRAASGMLRDILVIQVNETYEEYLARIVAPVDLVWGEHDREVPVEVARRARDLAKASAHVQLHVLANTGHMVPTERPAALVAHAQRLIVEP